MIYHHPASVFALVKQHFDNAEVREAALVIVDTDANSPEPVRLTAAEAYEALYGPDADQQLSAAIWAAVLSTARADRTAHGTARLLMIWLALPRLTGSVHRICRRLRADRSDVEAEMVLGLLEALTAADSTGQLSVTPLIKAARTKAWNFARADLRELPSTQVEHITQDRSLTPVSEASGTSPAQQDLEVQVDRLDGPDGLRAPLRFRVRREHLREDASGEAESGTKDSTPRRCTRRRRASRRVGTLPIRPVARRR